MKIVSRRHTGTESDEAPVFRIHTYRDVLAETVLFSGTNSPPTPIARHAHDDYQINLSLSNPGRYAYRRESFLLPPDAMAILHPGEPHAVQNLREPDARAETRLLYIPRNVVAALFVDVREPFVPVPLVDDADTVNEFLRLHRAISSPVPRMEQDTRLLEALEHLFARYSKAVPALLLSTTRREVERAREYLHEHITDDVTLTELASIVGLSAAHFLRIFRAHVGSPPHAYHLQLRLGAAKRMLLKGMPVAQIALDLGFANHSHFSARFKAVVGVSPSGYRAQHFLGSQKTLRHLE